MPASEEELSSASSDGHHAVVAEVRQLRRQLQSAKEALETISIEPVEGDDHVNHGRNDRFVAKHTLTQLLQQ